MIIKKIILYFIQIRQTDDFPSTGTRLVTIMFKNQKLHNSYVTFMHDVRGYVQLYLILGGERLLTFDALIRLLVLSRVILQLSRCLTHDAADDAPSVVCCRQRQRHGRLTVEAWLTYMTLRARAGEFTDEVLLCIESLRAQKARVEVCLRCDDARLKVMLPVHL